MLTKHFAKCRQFDWTFPLMLVWCVLVSCFDVWVGFELELTLETEANPVGKLLITLMGVSNFLFFRLGTSVFAALFCVVIRHRKPKTVYNLVIVWSIVQLLLMVWFGYVGVFGYMSYNWEHWNWSTFSFHRN